MNIPKHKVFISYYHADDQDYNGYMNVHQIESLTHIFLLQ